VKTKKWKVTKKPYREDRKEIEKQGPNKAKEEDKKRQDYSKESKQGASRDMKKDERGHGRDTKKKIYDDDKRYDSKDFKKDREDRYTQQGDVRNAKSDRKNYRDGEYSKDSDKRWGYQGDSRYTSYDDRDSKKGPQVGKKYCYRSDRYNDYDYEYGYDDRDYSGNDKKSRHGDKQSGHGNNQSYRDDAYYEDRDYSGNDKKSGHGNKQSGHGSKQSYRDDTYYDDKDYSGNDKKSGHGNKQSGYGGKQNYRDDTYYDDRDYSGNDKKSGHGDKQSGHVSKQSYRDDRYHNGFDDGYYNDRGSNKRNYERKDNQKYKGGSKRDDHQSERKQDVKKEYLTGKQSDYHGQKQQLDHDNHKSTHDNGGNTKQSDPVSSQDQRNQNEAATNHLTQILKTNLNINQPSPQLQSAHPPHMPPPGLTGNPPNPSNYGLTAEQQMMLSMHYQYLMNPNITGADSSNYPQQPPGFQMNPNFMQQQQQQQQQQFMMYQQHFPNQRQQNFQQNSGQHQQKFPPGFNEYSHQGPWFWNSPFYGFSLCLKY